jgi:hypothetical protein
MRTLLVLVFGACCLCACGSSDTAPPGPTADAAVKDGDLPDVVLDATQNDATSETLAEASIQDASEADAAPGEDAAEASADALEGGIPAKDKCASGALTGCYRGMYLSLYTDHIGKITFGGDTESYRHILGDAQKEQKVLDFIAANRIESAALYDLGTILQDATLQTALQSFIPRARSAGLLRVEAVGSTYTPTWDAVAAFHQSKSGFDGFVTEIEFWNGGATFQQLIDTAKYVRGLKLTAPGGGEPTLSVYAGWIDQTQADGMVPWIDRVYLHVYVDQASQAFGYGKSRMQMIADANASQSRKVDVWPIFSAEDHAWSAGAETFMGEWLQANGMDAAEAAFLGAYEADALHDTVVVSGFQYYDYFFLSTYLQ